jgi:hypothetical protein
MIRNFINIIKKIEGYKWQEQFRIIKEIAWKKKKYIKV